MTRVVPTSSTTGTPAGRAGRPAGDGRRSPASRPAVGQTVLAAKWVTSGGYRPAGRLDARGHPRQVGWRMAQLVKIDANSLPSSEAAGPGLCRED